MTSLTDGRVEANATRNVRGEHLYQDKHPIHMSKKGGGGGGIKDPPFHPNLLQNVMSSSFWHQVIQFHGNQFSTF